MPGRRGGLQRGEGEAPGQKRRHRQAGLGRKLAEPLQQRGGGEPGEGPVGGGARDRARVEEELHGAVDRAVLARRVAGKERKGGGLTMGAKLGGWFAGGGFRATQSQVPLLPSRTRMSSCRPAGPDTAMLLRAHAARVAGSPPIRSWNVGNREYEFLPAHGPGKFHLSLHQRSSSNLHPRRSHLPDEAFDQSEVDRPSIKFLGVSR